MAIVSESVQGLSACGSPLATEGSIDEVTTQNSQTVTIPVFNTFALCRHITAGANERATNLGAKQINLELTRPNNSGPNKQNRVHGIFNASEFT